MIIGTNRWSFLKGKCGGIEGFCAKYPITLRGQGKAAAKSTGHAMRFGIAETQIPIISLPCTKHSFISKTI